MSFFPGVWDTPSISVPVWVVLWHPKGYQNRCNSLIFFSLSFRNSKDKHRKKQGFFFPCEPLKSLGNNGHMLKKARNSLKSKKARKSQKAKKRRSGFGCTSNFGARLSVSNNYRVATVRFGYGSCMEWFERFRLSVPTVPLGKGLLGTSVEFSRTARFWFRFLKNDSGGSGSSFGFWWKSSSDGSGFRFKFGSWRHPRIILLQAIFRGLFFGVLSDCKLDLKKSPVWLSMRRKWP